MVELSEPNISFEIQIRNRIIATDCLEQNTAVSYNFTGFEPK